MAVVNTVAEDIWGVPRGRCGEDGFQRTVELISHERVPLGWCILCGHSPAAHGALTVAPVLTRGETFAAAAQPMAVAELEPQTSAEVSAPTPSHSTSSSLQHTTVTGSYSTPPNVISDLSPALAPAPRMSQPQLHATAVPSANLPVEFTHTCQHCRFSTNYSSRFANHMSESHPGVKRYTCFICTVTFGALVRYKKHWDENHTVSLRTAVAPMIFLLGLTAGASADQGTTCFKIDASTFQARHAHAEIYAEEIWVAARGTSSTSPTRSLNSLPPLRYFSGHVSWPLVNTVSNPFMFFTQATPGTPSSGQQPDRVPWGQPLVNEDSEVGLRPNPRQQPRTDPSSNKDMDRLRTLQAVDTSEEKTVPVQAYLTSGTDLCRYGVTGVDVGESAEELTCSSALDTPIISVLAELVALCDGLAALQPLVEMQHPSNVILYKDSAQAVRALRRVDLSLIRALFEYVGFAGLVFWLLPRQMPRAIL
ncbi:hypothetical protein HPB50_015751 [Hyalomma asiaticum]|uniref:Uncharacterized protein n=1 Tax=Hyalomma asiaticum TaxID=266040 RepID=A0ACB7SE85_HYAAI|nr:hypothetical protein HPB50_015751 [Hyalomma asiaticum]